MIFKAAADTYQESKIILTVDIEAADLLVELLAEDRPVWSGRVATARDYLEQLIEQGRLPQNRQGPDRPPTQFRVQ